MTTKQNEVSRLMKWKLQSNKDAPREREVSAGWAAVDLKNAMRKFKKFSPTVSGNRVYFRVARRGWKTLLCMRR